MLLSLRNITKEYTLGEHVFTALNNVSVDIEKGEFVAIMGPSGSGKSTLMHIIGLLDNPNRGSYFLDSKDITVLDNSKIASIRNRNIGFVFQSFNLLPKLSVIENVMLPYEYYSKNQSFKESVKSLIDIKSHFLNFTKSIVGKNDMEARAEEVLDLVGLLPKRDSMPNQLSGGQIQRVAIARSLVLNPSIILADEPTGNLDSKTSIDVMNILTELNKKGNTIILVTHEPDIAKFASRIIHVKDGQIIH